MDQHNDHHETVETPAKIPASHDDCTACREYRELSRRRFIEQSRLVGMGLLTSPLWLPQVALGRRPRTGGSGPRPDVIVYVFLRGGPDMLAHVVPYSDPFLYAAPYDSGSAYFEDGLRPTIGINPPDPKDPDPQALRCVDIGSLNGDSFGVNKALADTEFAGSNTYNSLHQLYTGGEKIAWVTAAGSPDQNRSHFAAESYIEYGTPNQIHDKVTGWLSRYLTVAPTLGSPMRAAALSQNKLLPKMLSFAKQTQTFQDVSQMVLPGNPATAAQRTAILQARYAAQTQDPEKSHVLDSFATFELLQDVDTTPDPLAKYTNSEFANRCRNAAALIKAGIDIEAIYLDRTGWDNHASLEPHKDGAYYNRLKDVSQNLAAFRIDLGSNWSDVTVIIQGEFGRQFNENGGLGTDHGNAGVITVMGGGVNPGPYSRRVNGTDGWPGLDPGVTILDDAMQTTIDYRTILREILTNRCGVTLAEDLDFIFPTEGEQPPYTYNPLGIVNPKS